MPKQKLPKLDFHDVVSRLSQYPELQRRMGLVVDLEIPAGIAASIGLEDLDDVQRVTANFDIPEDVYAEVAG